MFPVFILEGNENARANYLKTVENTIIINEIKMKTVCATGSLDLFRAHLKDTNQGLFFIDMEIEGDVQSGLQIASEIRRLIPMAKIVFITSHAELAFLTLERKIAPLDYILKRPNPLELKNQIIDDILLTYHQLQLTKYQRPDIFNYSIGNYFFSIPMQEVMYLYTSKSTPGHVHLVMANSRQDEFPGNLSAIEKHYPMLFRSDRSFLINLDNITQYDQKKHLIIFSNKSTAEISFRKSRELSKILKKRSTML